MPAGVSSRPHWSARRISLWVAAMVLWLLFAAILGMTLSQMANSHNGEYPDALIGFWLFLSVIPGASAFSLTQWLVLFRPAHD